MKNRRWKADEMEMAINFRAVRYAWCFLVLSLTAWCVYCAITTGEFPAIPFFLDTVSSLIFWFVKMGLTNKMTKTEQEDDEE